MSGAGLTKAIAGKQAILRVRLRDKYHNAALPAKGMRFGLAMLPMETQQQAVSKPKRQLGDAI